MSSVGQGAAQSFERIYVEGTLAALDERALLERFRSRRDEAAFEVLVRRFGPTVLAACRVWLADRADQEDAFQATFLVLLRRAGSIRDPDRLGAWLYGVANRVAARARRAAARRRAREMSERASVDERWESDDEIETNLDLRPAIHDELSRLPAPYRDAITLCFFEGLTHEEAARRLAWPIGTVKGRLSRAKALLRDRLRRRGLVASITAIGGVLGWGESSRAAPSEGLIGRTMELTRRALGPSGTKAIATTVAATLAEGVSQDMIITALWKTAAAASAACLLAAGGWVATNQDPTPNPGAPKAADSAVENRPPFTEKQALTIEATNKALDGRLSDDSSRGRSGAEEKDARFLALAQSLAAEGDTDALQTARVLRLIDQPISLSFFDETPLAEVLQYIKTATESAALPHGIQIYVDPQSLLENDITIQSPVTLSLEGIKLKTSLRLMLRSLKLTFTVQDGVLVIHSIREPVDAFQVHSDTEREQMRVERNP